MSRLTHFFGSRWGIISAGAFVGIFAPLLQRWGNPGNMGICVACMERDIAGALGLHRAADGSIYSARDYRLCPRGIDRRLGF